MARTHRIGRGRQSRRLPTTVHIIDRVLDKGIVIEYRARISIGGIDTLVAVDARYVVSSLDTFLEYGEPLQDRRLAQRLTRLHRPLSSR